MFSCHLQDLCIKSTKTITQNNHSSYVYMDTNNRNKSLIRIKMFLVTQKILIWYGPFEKNFHSKREGCFKPMVILTGVHVHTCSDHVFLVGVKLSFVRHVCPAFPRRGSPWCIPVCSTVNYIAAMMARTFALLPSCLSTFGATHAVQQPPFLVARSRKLPLSPV